jgi:hypothetical protein
MARFIPCGSATPVDDFKKSRMQFDNAANFDRKSGGSPPCFLPSALNRLKAKP